MKDYITQWKKQLDNNHRHTASTEYITENFIIWKGKYNVFSVLYSSNKWHLQRMSDGIILHSAKTAKECKEVFEYCIRNEIDINHCNGLALWDGIKFDDNFDIIYL